MTLPANGNQRVSGQQRSSASAPAGLPSFQASSGQPGARDNSGQPTQSALPAITVPKGGGAIRSIGEKFDVNPVSGAGSLTVPIATSPSRQDFYPKLSLSYDSGGGNSPFGLGWGLSIPSIARKTDKGIPRYQDYEESDTYILSGAEDLVPALKHERGEWVPDIDDSRPNYAIRRYHPRIEGLFARIERWQATTTGEVFWRAITRDNVVSLYGLTANSRIRDPDDEHRVFQWLLSASFDDRGNLILYEYKQENAENIDASHPEERNRLANDNYANRYVKRIKYGNRTPFDRERWRDMLQAWQARADRPLPVWS